MSFSKTTQQIRDRTKTVTRRLGWKTLKPGEIFLAVEKCQGLKKGEQQKPLAVLRCLSNNTEVLDDMESAECVLEGFPGMTSGEFIRMFSDLNQCSELENVQRIKFEYVPNDTYCRGGLIRLVE